MVNIKWKCNTSHTSFYEQDGADTAFKASRKACSVFAVVAVAVYVPSIVLSDPAVWYALT